MNVLKPFRLGLISKLVLCSILLATATHAQIEPRVAYICPAGGRQGTSFELVLGGQYLQGITNAYVTGSGVKASVLSYTRPLTQKEFNELKEKLQGLLEKRRAAENRETPQRRNKPTANTNSAPAKPWTAADEKAVQELRKKLMNGRPNKQANPTLTEVAILRITIAPEAEPGCRELRVITPLGLSRPLAFHIGDIPEYLERDLTNMTSVPPLTLPAVINGQIMPGEVDRYRFSARARQDLVVTVSARELIPYLADAVPGWFQAAVVLYDANGHELAYVDDYRFHPDPVLHYEIPRDGEYTLEIKDALYRGREDFVYRITLGNQPFISSIFPLGCRIGTETSVEVKGLNLPITEITHRPTNEIPGIYGLTARKAERVSNRVPFAVENLPECREVEPNNESKQAQPVTLPTIVNGRIDTAGDCDVFSFEGKMGQTIVAEVNARRLDSPLDSILRLMDASGKQIALNDDHEDKGSGLNTHHADSYISTNLPADGTYYLQICDAQHNGGPEYAYRLRISEPQPEFALRMVPSSLTLRTGMTEPVTVYALRKDGFTNAITLSLKGASGFTLSGGLIPANQDKVRVTLTAPNLAATAPVSLNFEGRAAVNGKTIIHSVIPAEDMEQAFAYHHLVPSKEFKVAVLPARWTPKKPTRAEIAAPVRIPVGGTAKVQISGLPIAFMDRLKLELSDPPEGLTIKNVSASWRGTEIELQSDPAKSKAGLRGNLIVGLFAKGQTSSKGKSNQNAAMRRFSLGTLPAIPFELVKN